MMSHISKNDFFIPFKYVFIQYGFYSVAFCPLTFVQKTKGEFKKSVKVPRGLFSRPKIIFFSRFVTSPENRHLTRIINK